MKQFTLMAFLCIGCATPIPESGAYSITTTPKINNCGEGYEMGDWTSEEPVEVTVDIENGQVSVDGLLLELDKNEATMEEDVVEQPIDDYIIMIKGGWHITWSTPTVASGEFGLDIFCEGSTCPSSAPNIADTLPCESKLNLEMEIVE